MCISEIWSLPDFRGCLSLWSWPSCPIPAGGSDPTVCGWIPGSHRKSPGGQVSVGGHFSLQPTCSWHSAGRCAPLLSVIPWDRPPARLPLPAASSSLPLPLTLKIKVSPSYPPLAFSCLSVEAGVPRPCLWVSTLWCPGTLGHSGAICADAPSGHAWPSPSAAFSPRVIVFAGIETEPCLRKVAVEGTKAPVFLSLPSREVLVNLGGWTQKRLS